VDRRPVQVKQPFGKNGDRNDAAGQNRPHQQAAFLDIVNHATFLDLFAEGSKLSGTAMACCPKNAWVNAATLLFSLRSWARRNFAANKFTVYIKNRITSLLACWIIAVNDLVEKRTVFCALSFFL